MAYYYIKYSINGDLKSMHINVGEDKDPIETAKVSLLKTSEYKGKTAILFYPAVKCALLRKDREEGVEEKIKLINQQRPSFNIPK